ncbi:MAG: lipoprotein insertase outer membrane protein LolB [Xanthomonadales bacterium]|nr:lipoprotein insertase outer membrane protein LolB [Xanthomonadales bacterium]
MQFTTRRWFYWLVAAVLLHGCSGVGTRQSGPGNEQLYLDRAGKLESVQHWGLVGRLSLDDGEQGGSGKLRWNVWPAGSDLDFHGAMGRGAWQLQVREGGATLKTSDGNVQTAPAVDALVQAQLGWSFPVGDLEWWVRGLRAPGAADVVQYDSDGLLLSLQQSGWRVEFKRYRDFGGTAFPVRLEAQRGSYRVKLAIGNWRLGLETGG